MDIRIKMIFSYYKFIAIIIFIFKLNKLLFIIAITYYYNNFTINKNYDYENDCLNN